MALQSEVLGAMATNQEKGRRAGRPIWGLLDQPLETRDGFIVVAIEDAAMERRFFQACNVDSRASYRRQSCRSRIFQQARIPSAVVCTDPAKFNPVGAPPFPSRPTLLDVTGGLLASVPHAVLLPVGVKRLYSARLDGDEPLLAHGRYRWHDGATYCYDLELRTMEGELRER
jgi:hypothetical protein